MLVIGTSFYSVATLFLGFYIINFIQLGANCVLMCFDFELTTQADVCVETKEAVS